MHLLFVLTKCSFNLFHSLRQFFKLQEITLCDLNDLGSFIFTVERRHRRKCFGGNNANCLVCNWAVLGGMCVNHLRWACPKIWTPIYDNAVTFGESVTALCLPPCPPDFEYKQITSCGFCQLSRESEMETPALGEDDLTIKKCPRKFTDSKGRESVDSCRCDEVVMRTLCLFEPF